jgi:hypothetical protein
MSVRTGDCHAGVGNEERHSSTRRQPPDPGEHGDEPCPGQSLPHPNISSVNPEEAGTVIRETKRSRYDGLHTGGAKI